jgi:hypothetical protein
MVESDEDTTDIERLVTSLLAESQLDLVRANSLKMVYTLLRDKNNMYPHL